MEKRKYRCHFAICDSIGYVLYSSARSIITEGESLLSKGVLSQDDTVLFESLRTESKFEEYKLLENCNSGKAIYLVSSLFPSTRTFVLLFTDIDFRAAEKFYNKDSRQGLRKTQKEKISTLLSLADNCFHSNFSSNVISSKNMLTRTLSSLAFLAGCEVNIICPPILPRYFEAFDNEFFCLFAFSALCAASFISGERKATISLSEEKLRMKIKIEFHKSDLKSKNPQLTERFEKLFSFVHSVSDRKNIPFSVLQLPDICLESMPYSLDFAILGIKEPRKRLTLFKSNNKQENEE